MHGTKGMGTGCAAAALLAAGTALTASPAAAHPHAWIDLAVTLEVDAGGRVVALEQRWRFDEFYTIFVLQDLADPSAPPDDAFIDDLMRQNLANLADYDYFTEVTDGQGDVDFATAEMIDGSLADGHLWLTFRVPLERPADAAAGPVEYAVFDPSYYVEIRHAEGADSVSTGDAAGCAVSWRRPEPEAAWLVLAAAADLGGGDDGLGALFAERVSVTCGSD